MANHPATLRFVSVFSILCVGSFLHAGDVENRSEKVATDLSLGHSILITTASETAEQPGERTLRDDIRRCLLAYSEKREDAAVRRPWGLMHVALAFGKQSQILVDGETKNGLNWLCNNGAGQGMRLLQAGVDEVVPMFGPGYEGHQGQLLSILAQCGVPLSQIIRVDEKEFTIEDLIAYEKRTCRPGTELTFKLIGFSHYLSPDDTWTNGSGEWNLERVLQEELNQPIQGASCGGTHRLNGISHAVLSRYYQGLSVSEGVWKRAEDKLKQYAQQAIRAQGADGRFASTDFNNIRIYEHDLNKRIWISGHTLEWLVYYLPEQDLSDPRIEKAVSSVAKLLLDNQHYAWEIGKKYHALHALAIYHKRAFGRTFKPKIEQLVPRTLQPPVRFANRAEEIVR